MCVNVILFMLLFVFVFVFVHASEIRLMRMQVMESRNEKVEQ